jgi:hypothetical protein
MKVEQIYQILNTITEENLGDSIIVAEDLSNIVDLGNEFENVVGLDNFCRQLIDHVGRVVFVDRVYGGRAPSVLVDGWEYGSILEKISVALPEAQENEMWNLQDGQSYDPFIFKNPEVTAKFFNDRVTFDIQLSITTKQVKSAFDNVNQMNAFVSMLYTSVANSATVKIDALIMRTINNMIGETLYSEFPNGTYTGVSGVRAVNLLKLYTDTLDAGDAIDADEFIRNPEAIRFSVGVFKNYIDRIKVMSTLFNIGGQERFTPDDRLHIVMLSEFANAADVYLQSDTFNAQYTALPGAERTVYWQGSGLGYDFDDTSAIKIQTSGGHTINATGVLAVMFDRDALGVANVDRFVTSQYNAKADFTNNFYHYTQGMWNDGNENFVLFYVA